jgi:hypothetical protein
VGAFELMGWVLGIGCDGGCESERKMKLGYCCLFDGVWVLV